MIRDHKVIKGTHRKGQTATASAHQIQKGPMVMDMLQKVELVREKCNVSYEDAKAALDATGGDVLDAIIWLEKAGKTAETTATYATTAAEEAPVSDAQLAAQAAYAESTRKTTWKEDLRKLWNALRALLRNCTKYKFIARRFDEDIINVPLVIPIVGLFCWGATIWLLILGLFFNLRYRVEGASPMTIDVNDAMDKAADLTDKIKKDVSDANE